MTAQSEIQSRPGHGAVIEVPLNRLKASPRNARRTPHAKADVEALAASIAAKGVIQPPVVEPEMDGDGLPTGYYLVTVGEGRRQALRLRAQRKEIGKASPIRCLVDLANDAHEISLDENITRFAMHPADQFEAFQQLAQDRGFGPEEIAARFGVTPTVVRQRLKLAAVSPALMKLYRQGGMTLDQLMAFTLSDDHARQEAVWHGLSWNKEPQVIRRALTEDRVSGRDKRAVYVGAEAYLAAGGVLERDLFADDHGGYYADPALLDRLAMEKLTALAEAALQEGWKWATPSLDHPSAFQMGRIYPRRHELPAEDEARAAQLATDYDALVAELEEDEDEAALAKLHDLDTELAELDAKRVAYDPEDIARAGVFVVLGPDGAARLEAGFIRREDEPASPEPDELSDEPAAERDEPAGPSPLPERLIADLTAHRSAALRHALGETPDVALAAVVHALALQCFDLDGGFGTCLDLRLESVHLEGYAPGLADSPAGREIEARHAQWAAELPRSASALWTHVLEMSQEAQLRLLAHCTALSLNAVQTPGRRSRALDQADALAIRLGLDMADYWTPTVESYLGRVTKPHILAAVEEGVGPEALRQVDGLKKEPMALAAQGLLEGRRWLPQVLRSLDAAPDPDLGVTTT
ncbi:ParB N-terminal domain-containing protein [Phenylobacterium sp. LH3H17]|uniref:ParB/RepB/Spo0J family partition protein n=1 Tax=Phenylobacterium sp. LH3H17 TaxID=2903901 RepID=UPI0020C94C50|nr:ParB/RepB/Spo0J family partition protein [Phenylobacterium sp. LH3H17]UTP39782.1 ParB N-terminal domain-containing protein [Phenylobacterium sp. LH3H17]